MGEAKNRKLWNQNNPAPASNILESVDRASFAAAVKQVVSAVTSISGADCILYSVVGAGLLNKLGIKSAPVAGSAAWRVGPGDADVISHASEIGGEKFAPEGVAVGLFHCWIQTVDEVGKTSFDIIDTSTWQIKKKARELDAMDGQVTKVDFCPDYIWVNSKSKNILGLRAVASSFDVGVFSYVRKKEIEKVIFNTEAFEDAVPMILAAEMCYKAMIKGEKINVMGVGLNGVEESRPDAPMNLRKISMRP